MIYFVVILSVLSQVILADEPCLNEEAMTKRADEIYEICKKDLPGDKKECLKTYMNCAMKESSLDKPGNYDKFVSQFMEYVSADKKEKIAAELEECKKKEEIMEFMMCTRTAMLKVCPQNAERSKKFSDHAYAILKSACP